MDGDRLPGEVEGRRLIKERLDVSGRGVGVVAISPRSLTTFYFARFDQKDVYRGRQIQLIEKKRTGFCEMGT